jgi:AcrR family transcriptional regulator
MPGTLPPGKEKDATVGRPKEFDPDQALAAALDVFRRQGFEGASLTALTKAMGITRPSLYAAFGNKEELFKNALDRYRSDCTVFRGEALAEPTSRRVVERLLQSAADAQTDKSHPPGCLVTTGALVCSEEGEPIRRVLAALRGDAQAALQSRLEQARAAGDLAADADPAALASYVMAVIQGMAVLAASGADRAALHGVVQVALRAWPN